MKGRRRPLLIAAGVLLVVAGLLFAIAPSLYEVVDEGRDLRPYEAGEVYKIRIADTVTVYAAEESRPETDRISGAALVALATAAFMAYLLLGAAGAARRLRLFYGLAAAGLAFLALDESFGLHETIGHNLIFLADVPGVERPDDLIIVLYLIPALAFLAYFRDVFMDSRWAVRLFAAGVVTFVLAGLSDVGDLPTDEPLEMLSATCILGGFAVLIAAHLSRALGLPRGAPAAEQAQARETVLS
ncbi:MAG TPA: hypothetical protein VHF90_05775 [Thermoleophilaceae bacterium]|nr:hypothetical protein [Thermoleophilaceae bacterium]